MKTHSDLPFISIIIPVYNKCQFLDRCFNSIINSTYSDLEIIVVNDGSTDGSGELCEKYQKKDIRFKVIHQSNTGVSAARNKGLDLARGKWIYFADADDWIDNDAFKGIVTAILLHPEVDFIRAYCREIIGDKVYNPKIPDKIQVFGKEFFLQSGFMPGYIVSMFVRRDVIEKNNLRLSAVLDYKEDAEFIFRCVMNSDKILLYNKVFVTNQFVL